jgi:hypothetical protein
MKESNYKQGRAAISGYWVSRLPWGKRYRSGHNGDFRIMLINRGDLELKQKAKSKFGKRGL